jgi:hypothetical protein
MHQSRCSFKETLNAAIRSGLGSKKIAVDRKPLVIHARPLGLRAGIAPTGFNKLIDDLEIDANVDRMRGIQSK